MTANPSKDVKATNGYQNIGMMMSYATKNAKDLELTAAEIAIYLHLVPYSIGYEDTTVICSYKDLAHICSRTTIAKSLHHLIELDLIKRVTQDFGPKKSYRYQIVFKAGLSIKFKKKYKIEETTVVKPIPQEEWFKFNIRNGDYDQGRIDYKNYLKIFGDNNGKN